jgi:uncharacterized membrane protein
MKKSKVAISIFSGLPIALLYALIVRLTFASKDYSLLFGTMTCGFLFLVPLAIGALTIRLAPDEYRQSATYAIFMPWVSIIIVAIGSITLALEAAICILMALPIFLFLSSLGGFLFREKQPNSSKSSTPQNTMLGIILLAPYLVTPFEMQLPTTESHRVVENEIRISASANVVWKNIVNIPSISSNEQQHSIFHTFGVPKLEEATLTHEGVGGIRSAVFENGLIFTETITYWDENHRIQFSISPSSQSTAPSPYKIIGSKYLAVTEMDYWIEQIDQDNVILHLRSEHVLTTHLNSYAGFWTELILRNVQAYALRIIKNRSEHN